MVLVMTGIEKEMAGILDAMGVSYEHEMGVFRVRGHCRSQYPCKVDRSAWHEDSESNVCPRDGDVPLGESEECDWWACEYYLYRVDFAVFVGTEKVAIECDGYMYHHKNQDLAKDRQKEEALRRAGWHVVRYRGSTIHNDKRRVERELRQLFNALKEKPGVQEALL